MHVFSSVNFIVLRILVPFMLDTGLTFTPMRFACVVEAAGGGARALRHGAAGHCAGRCGRTARAPTPAAGTKPTREEGLFIFFLYWICFSFQWGGYSTLDRHATHEDGNFRRPDARARGGRKQGATAEREDAAGRRQQGARTINTIGKQKTPTTADSRSKQTRHPPFFFVPQPAGTAPFFARWRAGLFSSSPIPTASLVRPRGLPNSRFRAPRAWWL